MILFFLIAAVFLGARLLVARALKIRPWLLPREGSLSARALVALGGPLACVLALVLLAFTVILVDGVRRPAPPAVTSVSPGSAAERAGLVPGDRIVAVEGRGVQTVADVQGQVQVTAGRPFALAIERAGSRQHLVAQAQLTGASYRLGVQLDGSGRYERVAPAQALREAALYPPRLFALMLRSFLDTLRGQPSVTLAGPVAVLRLAQQAPARGQLLLSLVGPWLLLGATLGAVLSAILLLVARPRRQQD
ncbi:MAG: M50 family metallopeptidase [Polyangia bacterium]